MTIKILNLYAGIGGNRRGFYGDIEVTAIEINPDIAKIYLDFFPKDNVIVTDAHNFLLEHYEEYDFIWTSPPCPTHSRILTLKKEQGQKMKYPDMKLWQEIIFLQNWFKGKFVVENVKTYYEPLIKPQEAGRHYFWANFLLDKKNSHAKMIRNERGKNLDFKMQRMNMFVTNFYDYKGDKRQLLNNCIEEELARFVFDCAFKSEQKRLEV